VDLDAAVRDFRRASAGIDVAQRAAKRRVDAARERADAARRALHAAMVEAAENGMRPIEIERRTGYTKERVRQILRAGGVEPD
jgi:hydrogenase maturation factor